MKKIMLAAVVLMLSACSSIKTNWDYNPDINFNQYKTYAWVAAEHDDEYHLDGLMDARVREAVDGQLTQKGLRAVDAQSAQLLVNYLTQVDTKVDVDTFTTHYGYHPYAPVGFNWRWGTELGQTHTQVREYDVGTLIVDLVDANTKKLIWRGSLEDIIRAHKTPQQRTEAINNAVAEIMMNYPPQPEQSE